MTFRFIPPDLNKFHQDLQDWNNKILYAVKEAYIMVCTDAVVRAKSTDTYKDQTNNLRSSIGFVLYYNGELVYEYFASLGTGSGGDGAEGVNKAKSLAGEVASRHADGFVAVIVAGMDYALVVETGHTANNGTSITGRDVLSGAVLNISKDLQERFDDINKQHGTTFGERYY